MSASLRRAEALLRGDPRAVERLARHFIKPLNNNLVPRPWGGTWLLDYKGLASAPEPERATGMRAGEAFELAADAADPEAARYPSRVSFPDGSELVLTELLEANAQALLGPAFVERYGARIPLLPKTLDIKELLSVQGHPPGNTEVYVIIAADPGATLRLGFKRDMDAVRLGKTLRIGQQQQAALGALLADGTEAGALQAVLAPWFAQRELAVTAIEPPLRALLAAGDTWPQAKDLLAALKTVYWQVLDALNTIPVEAGQIIHNATPERLLGERGGVASAEVHALGNPEGKEILALEIRRPGPTLRAWDNVRFPVREIDIDAALHALNLQATRPKEFIVEPRPVSGRAGVYCSIDVPGMRVEHLRPSAERPVEVPAEPPHCLHAIRGAVVCRTRADEVVGQLGRGESALVPAGVGAYVVSAFEPDTEIVKVDVPLG